MLQENGRLDSADNTETSACSSKNMKKMYCSICSVYFDVLNVEFGETKCPKCNSILTDALD